MMEAKMMIAGSFDEFVEKITQAERKALNTPFGQELTERLLKMKLEENPDMTAEEWQDTKSQFLTFLFRNVRERNAAGYGRTCPAYMGRIASKRSIMQPGGIAAAQKEW